MQAPLPTILEEKLTAFRKRVWIIKLTEGILAGIFGLGLSYAVVFALDRFWETPAAVRGGILITGALVLGIGLPLKWHRWVWKQRRLEDAARLIRRKFPRLGDQLLGIVELARHDSGRSETLVRAAMQQAAEAVKDRDFTQAVPEAKHRTWAWACAGVLVLAGLALGLVPEAARNALARWITPWKDVERFTFARVDDLPARLVVPFAEPYQLDVALAKNTEWSPSRGKVRLEGLPALTAERNAQQYQFRLPPLKEDHPMALSVGDVRKTVQVQPRNRPELISLSAQLQLPEYLKYKTSPVIEARGGSISLLKGASASFTAKASGPLATAELDGVSQEVEASTLKTKFTEISSSSERLFTWKDTDGLTPREPLALKVNAVADEAPKITARRETLEQVVLETEVLMFDLNIQDDFGIQKAGLEWKGRPTAEGKEPLKGEKISAAGEPEKREMSARATFCAARDGVAPQTLEIRAWADDYLPARERSKSAAFVVHILNQTDHALWLTEQLGRWLHSARESYEREQQLHVANRDLRGLSAAELDRPENRRKVMQQSAAESTNAERLNSLTQGGKQLVEQATKNPEFDAARLESWATMLKSLDDIAANRMPNVADLLKQSSNAGPGNAKSQPSTAANSKESQNSQNGSKPSDSKPSDAKPSDAKPGEGKQGDSKPSAPQVSNGQMAGGPGKSGETKGEPKPPAPSVSDNEPGLGASPPPQQNTADGKPKPPGGSKLSLPSTMLGAAPGQKPDDTPPPESPAQENMDKALNAQRELLKEFAKVSDELGDILSSLEASTFVKRLKAASKEQMSIAGELNQKTLDAFGLDKKSTPEAAKPLAERQKAQSTALDILQSDLTAYAQRKADMHFKNVLEQMKKTEIVRAVAKVGERTIDNYSGQSIHSSEYWADTLDRWAEEMVAASNCKSSSCASSDSLPPEVVLKVMQALRDEMKLRDETRELESARTALEEKAYKESSEKLAGKQGTIGKLIFSAGEDITNLPEGEKRFAKEIKLLAAVSTIMTEAENLLASPNTGGQTIAAESEAIELLLQARRQPPGGGGGGGGSNPGGGGTAASASSAALADLGPGSDAKSEGTTRQVGQSTGKAGKSFPEEYKTGLDAYFHHLESSEQP